MIGHFDKVMRRGRRGQATAEYIIIVALVAVAAIAVITFFGSQIKALFSHSTAKLAGEDDTDYTDDASAIADDAVGERDTANNLGEF